MPLVWLGRLLGFRSMGRVCGTDLTQTIFANRDYRTLKHFFYGLSPLVIAQLKKVLVTRFGQFNDVGSYCPPLRPLGFAEDEDVLSRIRKTKPHFVWVGLSTPKQEVCCGCTCSKLQAASGIAVGAAFDLVSGITPRAPNPLIAEAKSASTIEPARG